MELVPVPAPPPTCASLLPPSLQQSLTSAQPSQGQLLPSRSWVSPQAVWLARLSLHGSMWGTPSPPAHHSHRPSTRQTPAAIHHHRMPFRFLSTGSIASCTSGTESRSVAGCDLRMRMRLRAYERCLRSAYASSGRAELRRALRHLGSRLGTTPAQ